MPDREHRRIKGARCSKVIYGMVYNSIKLVHVMSHRSCKSWKVVMCNKQVAAGQHQDGFQFVIIQTYRIC